jgi:hypothetical protein
VDAHETPTRLRQGASFYGVPVAVLPWLALGALAAGAVFFLATPWVALLTGDRWLALGLRLAFALAAGAPIALLAAPSVIYGRSVPRFVLTVLRSAGTPRLTVWRPVAPCDPVPPVSGPVRPRRDGWGTDREEW